jgi:hypothetical protein
MAKNKTKPFQRDGGYFTMDRAVYWSGSFQSLTTIDRVVIFHLTSYYIPNRIEKIAMSSRRLAAEVGINKDTAAKSLKRLTEAGFLSIVSESMWLYGKARSYRLTFKPFNGRIPTDEWARD